MFKSRLNKKMFAMYTLLLQNSPISILDAEAIIPHMTHNFTAFFIRIPSDTALSTRKVKLPVVENSLTMHTTVDKNDNTTLTWMLVKYL